MDDRTFSHSAGVLAAVDGGRKIEAIKRLREETGLGLKEAKHAIDALARERQGDPTFAANMAEAGGASGVIKLVVVIAVVLTIYLNFFAR